MKAEDVKTILAGVDKLKVGVLGDIALDAYWMLEDGVGEVSVETGKQALVVRLQTYSLGGGGEYYHQPVRPQGRRCKRFRRGGSGYFRRGAGQAAGKPGSPNSRDDNSTGELGYPGLG